MQGCNAKVGGTHPWTQQLAAAGKELRAFNLSLPGKHRPCKEPNATSSEPQNPYISMCDAIMLCMISAKHMVGKACAVQKYQAGQALLHHLESAGK
jgi:hypothetical protein